MVGLSKERILACMGPPATKATEGGTEVWSYNSGNGYIDTQGTATNFGHGFASFGGVSTARFCTVNLVMNNGIVSQVNYVGPTGGLLTKGEQCSYAIDNCVK